MSEVIDCGAGLCEWDESEQQTAQLKWAERLGTHASPVCWDGTWAGLDGEDATTTTTTTQPPLAAAVLRLSSSPPANAAIFNFTFFGCPVFLHF